MREILGHKPSLFDDEGLAIHAVDAPGNGGANHVYDINHKDLPSPVRIRFQDGPIGVAGVNGLTLEALLAIVADRLRGFQRGAYACKENQVALDCTERALASLHDRTLKRIERGVEGKQVV